MQERSRAMPPIKVAFIVQRYGLEVNGGAEFHCRQVAEHMAKYWNIEILTTCAIDYVTWQNAYPPGPTAVNGVRVRRFPVDRPRNMSSFNRLSAKVFAGGVDQDTELAWMRAQGPFSSRLLSYLQQYRSAYDVYIFFTYLYASTFFSMPLVAERSALVPTAHDEPPIYLGLFNALFRLPQALIFNTPEEQNFVNNRFGTATVPQDVIGVGIEVPSEVSAAQFLNKHHEKLRNHDFILYVGRIDTAKGCPQLFSYFAQFRKDVPGYPLKLVLLGSAIMEIPAHPDILYLGFVSEQEKFDAIAAAKLVILPSPYESLSLVALEAWRIGTPVLATGACPVLMHQCIRSNGGLWYDNYVEFREALCFLLHDLRLRRRLGAAGCTFVQQCYSWPVVESKYLELINRIHSPGVLVPDR